jgi:ATP-binding cassette subfamily C (CFTR/MRP) protein 1
LRKKVTVIPQDPTLFAGTLKFNLDPFEIVEEQRLLSLMQEAGLEELLEREPDDDKEEEKEDKDKEEPGKGLMFKIKENGSNLSSGEKQLICICRAIL